jgi:hypothetical protein
MIKIIVEKSIKLDWYFKSVFNNVPSDSWSQIGLMIDILNSSILTDLMHQEQQYVNYKIGNIGEILINYENLLVDDYYLAFYDRGLDAVLSSNSHDFNNVAFDKETPMLRFSKANFDFVLIEWVKIKEQNSKYVIITQDDSGWIGLQGKQELDADELEMVRK